MATPYAPRSFFRQVANSLLQDYFESHSLLDGFKWEDLGETDTEPLHEAWVELPQGPRVRTDADFRDVHNLADEAGIHVVIEEAEQQQLDLAAALGELDDFHDQALWVFLHHPRVFDIASKFSRADGLLNRSWQKRGGLALKRPDTDEATIARFRQALVDHHVKREGRCLRVSEMAGLDLDDLDLEDRELIVRQGKNRRSRRLRFTRETPADLQRYLLRRSEHPHVESPALWIGKRGRVTKSGMYRLVKRRGEQVGIELHPHMLRHTLAHRYRLAGGDDDSLMRTMGWRSREMLARYGASAAEARAAELHEQFSPRRGL